MMTPRAFAADVNAFTPVALKVDAGVSDRFTYDEMVQQTYCHTGDFEIGRPAAYREPARYTIMAANSQHSTGLTQ